MRVYKIVILVIFMFLFGFGTKVTAAPGVPWEDAGFCAGDQLPPEDVRKQFVGGNDGDQGDLYNILMSSKVCGVGIRGKEIWGDDKSDGPVYACGNGLGFPQTVPPLPQWKDVCCPQDKPVYINLIGRPIECCPTGAKEVREYFGEYVCWTTYFWGGGPIRDANGDSIKPITAVDPAKISPPDGVEFVAGIDRFSCPRLGCFTNKADEIRTNDTIRNPITEADITSSYNCYAFGAEKPGTEDPPLFCAGTDWMTQDEIDSGGGPVVREQCALISDPTEQQRCFDCFANNPDPDSGEPSSFIYTSLGCIDTRQNPFITRLFQIGFGLLGGFAIIMIMWGSVQRQSTDPAKIQEGWDKIKAAIASIAMLAAAIPLLRFLGINLLELLPITIFS